MKVSPSTLQAIKAAPLSSVIEATGGRLKRVGHEFLTQCLWHDDTNPSLTVNDDKGFCYCHVCRQGGDAVDYLQERYKLSMFDAASKAAEILGINFEVDDANPELAAKRLAQRRAAVSELEKQQAAFRANLRNPKAGRVRDILKTRGLTAEASREFGIGFASDGFFGGRITVPIHNHRNELVGFTARATKPDQTAKYKNSPDSDLFNKKALVFNEVRAKEAAREAGSIIFVEGHLDVVSMWQAGIRNVVAMQGTAAPDGFTLARLAKAANTFVLCFDGDAGGRKAAEHFISTAGPMALAGEISVNVVTLPEGKDPDEVIRSGDNLYNYVVNAPSWLDWVIDTWAAALDKTDTAMITEVENKLRQLIDGMRSRALRAHYIDRAARVLATSTKEAEKLAKEWGNHEYLVSGAEWRPRTPAQARLAAERRLMRLYVHRQERRAELRPMLKKVTNPALKWLQLRLEELEEHCATDLTPHSVMAVVAVAEPHYMQQLRTLIRPNVTVDDSPGVLAHLASIMEHEIVSSPDESDPDQPSA